MRRLLSILGSACALLLASLALTATALAAGAPAPNPAPAASPSPATATAPSPALQRIQKQGVINVATTGNGPPDSYTEGGRITGAMPELMRQLADRWGVRIEWQIVPFSGLVSSVTSGRADVLADALFITPQRARQVAFSTPVYGWSDGIVVRAGESRSYPTLAALEGRNVGVLSSSVQYDELNEVGGIHIKSYDGYEMLTQDLSSGRLDAGLVDPPSVDYILARRPEMQVEFDKSFKGAKPAFVGFAAAKDHAALAGDIDAALRTMRADGSLKQLVVKYEGPNVDVPGEQAATAAASSGEAADGSFFGNLGSYLPSLLSGLKLTVLLALASLVASTILGLLVATARMSRLALIRYPARVYIDVIRGTPLLLQIFFLYYGLPQLGLVLDAFVAGILALSLNYGAYLAEIFRGGIEGVPVGQTRAAEALGMTRWQALTRVTYPQALRTVFPAYVGMSLSMIKDTSLVAVITLQELLFSGQLIVNKTFEPLQVFAMVGLMYLLVSSVVSVAASRVEAYLRTPGSQGPTRRKTPKAATVALDGGR